MERRIYWGLLALILALGVYIRVVDLGGPALWHDEILHILVAEDLDAEPWYMFLTGVREVAGYSENGPIYYWLQMLGQRLAPGETGARLFPAVFGILALPLMALCGHRLGGRLVSLTGAFLLAVSPMHVYFSREGRPYSLIILLALFLLFVLLEKGTRLGIVSAYVGCLVAAYVGVHTVPILLAFLALSSMALLWSLRGGDSIRRSPYRHGVVAAVLALGLVYGLYLARSETNKVDFEEMESPVFLSPLSERAMQRFMASMTTSGHKSILMERRSWVFIGFFVIGLGAGLKRWPGKTLFTLGMFVLPSALSILALVSVGRWYALRYTCSALPAFLLLVAVGVVASCELVARIAGAKLPKPAQKAATWVSVGILTGLFAAPNLAAARADPQRKLDWRQVVAFLEEVTLEGEPIIVANAWPEICLRFYLRGSERQYRFVNLEESLEDGQEAVDRTARGWLLTAGFRATSDVRAWMHRFQPVLKMREEELALFFFPDFSTLLETRFAKGRGGVFERWFEGAGERFDFGGAELTLLGAGWSYQERNKAGISYQWAMGEQAELGLPISSPRDAKLRFRALPFSFPEAPEQAVELWLNESMLAAVDLPRGWSDHEIEVPRTSWGAGANVLYLRFARTNVPAEVVAGSKDRRSLSAAFDFLEIVDP